MSELPRQNRLRLPFLTQAMMLLHLTWRPDRLPRTAVQVDHFACYSMALVILAYEAALLLLWIPAGISEPYFDAKQFLYETLPAALPCMAFTCAFVALPLMICWFMVPSSPTVIARARSRLLFYAAVSQLIPLTLWTPLGLLVWNIRSINSPLPLSLESLPLRLLIGAIAPLLILAAYILHVAWAVRRLPRNPGDQSVCVFCRYSLIGLQTPHCPECGHAWR